MCQMKQKTGKKVSHLGTNLLHVDGVPCRRLHVAHPVSPRQLLCLVLGHLTLSLQVTLVANEQEDDAVRLDVAPRLLQPVVDVLEGTSVCDVKKQQTPNGVPIVGPGDGP